MVLKTHTIERAYGTEMERKSIELADSLDLKNENKSRGKWNKKKESIRVRENANKSAKTIGSMKKRRTLGIFDTASISEK